MYGLSGSNLAIGVSLILRDRFTAGARQATASMRDMNKEMLQAQREQMEMQRNMNAVGAGIGLMAIRGMKQWVDVGAEFGYTMNYVSTIAEKKGAIGFDQLSQKAKTLGADTMYTAFEVGDAMKYMAMAGQDTANIFNNIDAAVGLAGATMSQLGGKGGTADIMTNIMRGFSIEGTAENSMRVADVLTTATTSANTSLHDMAEAMKYSISTANDLNVSLEETAAAVMMAGDAGIQGSMAGTATENMLRYVTRAADETRKGRSGQALSRLGLGPEDLKDAQGNLLAISPMLRTIAQQIKGMSNVDAQNVLTDIFGVRGKRSASLLLRNMEDFDKYVDKLNNNATGKTMGNLASQMDTLQGQMWQLSSAWGNIKIAFTESVEPVLKPILQGFTYLVKILTKAVETPVGAWLTAIGAGMVVWKTIAMGYKAIILSLRLLHMDLGGSFSKSSTSIIGGYRAMTAAANGYTAAASRASMPWGQRLARRGFGTYTKTSKTGRDYGMHGPSTIFQKKGSKPQGWSHQATRAVTGSGAYKGLGKFGNKFGGMGMMSAALGGTAISMGGDAIGGDAGKYISMGGNALGMAGTGAMIGSIFGPVGTAVGAIVGGVGSLGYDVYNELKKTEDKIDEAADALKGQNKPSFNLEEWRKKASLINAMSEGDQMFLADDPALMVGTNKKGYRDYLGGESPYGPTQPTNITINIDGKKAMERVVRKNDYETLLNLDLF